jgi:hypothetical protein
VRQHGFLGGATGVRSQSQLPHTCAHADRFGLRRDPRSRFSVRLACSNSSSHRCSGNWVSVVQSPATRWFLNVRMARSVAFRRCCPAGTSWCSTSSVARNSWSSLEHSLSYVALVHCKRARISPTKKMRLVLLISHLFVRCEGASFLCWPLRDRISTRLSCWTITFRRFQAINKNCFSAFSHPLLLEIHIRKMR